MAISGWADGSEAGARDASCGGCGVSESEESGLLSSLRTDATLSCGDVTDIAGARGLPRNERWGVTLE
jgi:hypothetical protein